MAAAERSQERRHRKERLYELFSEIASAMANPRRLELVDLLTQAPRTVEELAGAAHMSIANTSQHLQRLKRARLVVGEREGTYVRYALADPAVAQLWLQLRELAAQQNAEVEQALDAYRRRRHEFEPISAAELRARLARDEVVLLDVRPRDEYEAGHVPEAISMPLEELEKQLDHLPAGKTVVAYCRGPFCVIADDALTVLAGRGLDVRRLEEGVAEWQRAGYAVEGDS
jgi:rhodanese-related sulfurtransferase/predicted transcriptional regulator